MSRDPTDTQRRKRLSSQERREEFIAKAIEFFAENGFESSTRELASRLGVTQPLLYRYFPSKDDLIAEVYETVYVNRWRPDWEEMLVDRRLPMRERLTRFYLAYTDVVFQRDWMRIFFFAGLKGVDINPRYLARVRSRILVPIVRECRHEAGLSDISPSDAEVEYAWVMHGGIYYYGIRSVVYGHPTKVGREFAIRSSIDAFLSQLPQVRDEALGGAPEG